MANLNLDHVVTYTPEVDENRESETPWTISFAPMTAGDNRRYLAAAISTGLEFYEQSEQTYIDEVYEAMTKASILRDGLKKS